MRHLLVGFDFETTSAKPDTARVVQAVAVALDVTTGETVEVMNALCKPGDLQISDGARDVHGISNEMVADCEEDSVVLRRFTDWLYENQDHVILAGHNAASFDDPILWRVAGVPRLNLPMIDTYVCATRTLCDAPDHKLSNLVQYLKLDDGEGAHDAVADVRMVGKLVDYFRNGLGMTHEQLAEWCGVPRVLSIAHFGKHKGKKWGRAPAGSVNTHVPYFYAKFVAENFDSPSPDMVATLRYHYGLRFSCLQGETA